MKNKILLDCTFRDGGYYNKWHFDLKLFNEYIKCMYKCKIDIIELGFRFSSKNSFLGNFAYSTENFLNKLVLPKKLKYAVMINAKEFYHKEKRLLKLFKPKKLSKINIVRIAINFNEFKRSKKIIKILNDLNYEVGLNLMQAHDRTKEEISNVLSEIKSWSLIIDYLYFADSLGCMDNEYVKKTTENFCADWNGHIGIHAHNNKSMALSNTLESLKHGASICDSTIMGMGRGAGNAQTELLIQEMKNPLNISQLKSLNLILNKFIKLKNQYQWGYNFLYYYAANNRIHPTYIQSLVSEKRYSEIQILNILSRLSKNDLLAYSKSKIDEIFFENYNDLQYLKKTNFNETKYKKAIIIGNGISINKNLIKVKNLLKQKNHLNIFLNKNKYINNKSYSNYTVVVNTLRLLSDLNQYANTSISLIAPIKKFKKLFNLKFKNKKIINYPVCIKTKTFNVNKKYTIIPYDLALNYALSVCKILNIKEIYFIGIDGYEDAEKNLELINSIDLFKKSNKDIKIFSYTDFVYKSKIIEKLSFPT